MRTALLAFLLLGAAVDVLAHSVRDQKVGRALIAAMKSGARITSPHSPSMNRFSSSPTTPSCSLLPKEVRATEAIYSIWHNGFGGQPYVGVDKLGWDGDTDDSDEAITP